MEMRKCCRVGMSSVLLMSSSIAFAADGSFLAEHGKLIFGAALLLAVSAWGWNKFIRNRCPDCNSAGYDTTNIIEGDRWRGTKVVRETHSRGSNTRHVQTTFVNMVYEFRCRSCQCEWAKERKEELGALSLWQRIMTGF